MLERGSLVIAHLINPTEKFWGVLEHLDASGAVLRAIGVESFDDWSYQVARREPPTLGLSSMFVPLFRVERIFLDEQVGEVESYRQRFASRAGMSVEAYLGLSGEAPEAPEIPS